MAISSQAQIRPSPAVIVRTFDDGESVLLHRESEYYFGLNTTGTAMWQTITTAATVEDACRALLDTFDADPATLRADVDALIEQWATHGLVRVEIP